MRVVVIVVGAAALVVLARYGWEFVSVVRSMRTERRLLERGKEEDR